MRRLAGVLGWMRGYRVEWRWKEEVIYWKWTTPFTRLGYVFDGGWGASPPVTYVPSAENWDAVVPVWMVGKRDQVLRRVSRSARQVIEATDEGYAPEQEFRVLGSVRGTHPDHKS